MPKEKKPTFLSYRIFDIKRHGSIDDYDVGDFVIDKYNILGKVKFSSSFGNFIEFVDGYTVYDNIVDLGLKKTVFNNQSFFDNYSKKFGTITKMARVIVFSFEDKFPYIHLFNNGNTFWIRASTQKNLVFNYTNQNVSDSMDFISIAFTPFFNFELETFAVKKSRRKSSWSFQVLRDMFIDIDLEMGSLGKRFNYIISDQHEYDIILFEKITKQFSKFNIKIQK